MKPAKGAPTGEPIERDGVILLPVLNRRGRVRGAYVIRDGNARWEPAFDLNAAIVLGNLTTLAAIAFAWWLIRRRSGLNARRV